MKSMKSAGVEIIFVNPDSFHFSFYGHISTTTFFTEELQQFLIFQDFSQLIDDYNNVIDIVNRRRDESLFVQPLSFANMIELIPSLPGVKDLSSKSEEELASLRAEYESLCLGRSIDNQRKKRMKQLERDIEEERAALEAATIDSTEIQGRLLVLETELAQLKSQPKANAEVIEKRRQEKAEAERIKAEAHVEKRRQEKAEAERIKAEAWEEAFARSISDAESRRLDNSDRSIDNDAALGKFIQKGKRKL